VGGAAADAMAPARRARTVRPRVIAAASIAAALAVCAVAASAGAGQPAFRVVATHLNNPRKIFVVPNGAVYVVEAGLGGRSPCFGKTATATCVGLTGSITKIADGQQRRVVTGLVSFAYPSGDNAQGPSDVRVTGDTYDVLFDDDDINSIGANGLGPDATTAGDLISTPAGKASPSVIVNLAAFEAARNPSHGAGPGPKFGDPHIDSNPYAFTSYRGGEAIVDAAADDLLWVSPSGAISVLAVFPTQREALTPTLDRLIGAPATMRSITVQAVPTSVVVGPDGALYVGELTGAPYEVGKAVVWRVVPGKKMTVFASGFTNISDVAFDGKDLLVLEIAAKGLLDMSSPGALIRVAPNRDRTVIASRGLIDPTGIAVGNGSIYISNFGTFRGTGSGPHGELVSLPASLGA
jgi:hypothetical protein